MKKRKIKRKKSHALNYSQFHKELKKLCPGMETKRRTIIDNNGKKKKILFWEFPPLDVCREMFEQAVDLKIDW